MALRNRRPNELGTVIIARESPEEGSAIPLSVDAVRGELDISHVFR
jgi:hypothetical protein